MKFETLSPCKLNLFLYITGRRPDGYHNLQTLFVILNYGDRMYFETTEDDRIELLTDFGFDYKRNLIYRAAMLLKERYHPSCGVRISIDKTLPQGGGLGGGSANAATTLLVLNRLWGLNLDEDTLISLGYSLGADVPVFIKGTSCFAEGIGEILTPVELPLRYYLVATPDCSVPTKELFASQALKKDYPVRTYEELLKVPFENCFTPVVIREYPEVLKLLKALSAFGTAYMSGSGSSCFVAFEDEISARKAQKEINKLNIRNFIARSVNKSQIFYDLKKI